MKEKSNDAKLVQAIRLIRRAHTDFTPKARAEIIRAFKDWAKLPENRVDNPDFLRWT